MRYLTGELFFFAKERIAPKAMESIAAIKTLYSAGKKKVMVWAGIQKNGMVLTQTKETKPLQSTAPATSDKVILDLPLSFKSI